MFGTVFKIPITVLITLCEIFDRTRVVFSRNPRALLIILYIDGIEVVNPIGVHIKKHKLNMPYFTLANIPPEHRSKLTTIQLLAIAKTKDITLFGTQAVLAIFSKLLIKWEIVELKSM